LRLGRMPLLLFVMLCIFVAGCGNTEKMPSQAKEIAMGGQLKFGSLYEPNTLNPLLSELLTVSEVGMLIFSGLTVMNDKGEWLPDLAAEVPTLQNGGVSQDGLVVTYKLKQGVTWHDGAPFTAEDVKFTWQMITNPKINVFQREGYNKIVAIETPDKYTVTIRFKEYYPPYLTLFNFVMPKHILASVEDINKSAFNRAPIGTGPFKLKKWHLAEAIVLEANPSYFRGKPNLDSIVYKIVPDQNILLSQLKAGELDIVNNIDSAQLDQVKAIDAIQVYITPSLVWEHLDFNLDNRLFQDVRVRQAIMYSIDRRSIVNNILKDAAILASETTNPARDVDRARDLLIQAGWKQGSDGIFAKDGQKLIFSLTITAGNKVRESAAQLIADQLREVGIGVEVSTVDQGLFFEDVLKTRKFQTAMYSWVLGVEPDIYSLWHSKRIPTSSNGYTGQNYPGWRNAEVDGLVEASTRTIDVEKRRQIYYRVQEIMERECPVVPLYYRANIDAVKKNVVNYKSNPSCSGNLWNAWEWGFSAK
jgi:peptide/nickel transport system substrate-binding protein